MIVEARLDHQGHLRVAPQAFTRRLKDSDKDLIDTLHAAGATPTIVSSIISANNPNATINGKDISTYLASKRGSCNNCQDLLDALSADPNVRFTVWSSPITEVRMVF